jgi:S-adenosylmethionine synthetase
MCDAMLEQVAVSLNALDNPARAEGGLYLTVLGTSIGSQIGQPIDQPPIASSQVMLHPGVTLTDVQPSVTAIIEHELSTISTFTARLAQGELAVW